MGIELIRTGDHFPLQVWTPDPAKTVKLTVPAAGTVVWTVPQDTAIYRFQPTCPIRKTINGAADGPTYTANTDEPYAAEGVHPSTSTISFTDTATAGGVVVIEAM